MEEIYRRFLQTEGIQTDTRKAMKGKMFVALVGDRFDGHDFVEQAFAQGALYALTSNRNWKDHPQCLMVQDTLVALQDLARHHRRKMDFPILALTGSNGKTSSKELISRVLSTKFKVYHTQGNLNNHIGVPLSLLELRETNELAVIEMGANHQKEISALCDIAEPDLGLITNIGKAHIEGFGGVEGIRKGKGEIYDYLKREGGVIFCNTSEAYLEEMLGNYDRVVKYSDREFSWDGMKYHFDLIEGEFAGIKLSVDHQNFDAVTGLVGGYNFRNIVLSVVVGLYFGIQIERILNGLDGFTLNMNRSQKREIRGVTYIMDAYNANPTSMEAALSHLGHSYGNGCVAILGEMKELGRDEEKYHSELVTWLSEITNLDRIFLIGKAFESLTLPAKFSWFQDIESARKHREEVEAMATTILIKGSRSNQLEKWLED